MLAFAARRRCGWQGGEEQGAAGGFVGVEEDLVGAGLVGGKLGFAVEVADVDCAGEGETDSGNLGGGSEAVGFHV